MSFEKAQDAITEDEISGTAASASSPKGHSRNAFTELMSSKPKPAKTQDTQKAENVPDNRRGQLANYIHAPEKYPNEVLYHNRDFVAINDLYPKSVIHTLLLPCSPTHTSMHPFEAFEDPAYLASVKAEVLKVKGLVAIELRRKLGRFSAQDAKRHAILMGEVELQDCDKLPEGRDWLKSVRAGVHAHPSMHNIHVHVMGEEMMGECLRHKKHYNSFVTDFFVPIEDFPLAEDDPRRHPGRAEYLDSDLKCWCCGKNFMNKFRRLKEHLAEEFEEWKKE